MKVWEQLLRYALGLVLGFYILNQVRKPNRGIGRFFLWIMNKSHSNLTDWGFEACGNRKRFHNSGCWLRRRPDDSEAGGNCDRWHGLWH